MPNCPVSNSPTIFLFQELLDDDLLDVKLSEDGDEEKSPNSSPMLLVGGDDYCGWEFIPMEIMLLSMMVVLHSYSYCN